MEHIFICITFFHAYRIFLIWSVGSFKCESCIILYVQLFHRYCWHEFVVIQVFWLLFYLHFFWHPFQINIFLPFCILFILSQNICFILIFVDLGGQNKTTTSGIDHFLVKAKFGLFLLSLSGSPSDFTWTPLCSVHVIINMFWRPITKDL